MHGDERSAGADQRRTGAGQGKQDGFVTIAKVTKTQGRKGEVAATLLTDFPERFASRKRLFAWAGSNDTRRELELLEHWFHKGQVVLKFAGVDSISDAETLLGCEIQIPASERAELQDGSLYVSDLVGCTLLDSGRVIGKIEDVQFGSGEAPLLVVKGEKEYLIPLAAGFIDKIELEHRRVSLRLPLGMLELDAPLSEEEKQEQRRQD
ncbi:MAG TPA: ribosome maturation factor RimM [Alphaproteobacteria bacterium]|nr:ribosome maturation factor RimM [Alphaproteobacteria bacterium]